MVGRVGAQSSSYDALPPVALASGPKSSRPTFVHGVASLGAHQTHAELAGMVGGCTKVGDGAQRAAAAAVWARGAQGGTGQASEEARPWRAGLLVVLAGYFQGGSRVCRTPGRLSQGGEAQAGKGPGPGRGADGEPVGVPDGVPVGWDPDGFGGVFRSARWWAFGFSHDRGVRHLGGGDGRLGHRGGGRLAHRRALQRAGGRPRRLLDGGRRRRFFGAFGLSHFGQAVVLC